MHHDRVFDRATLPDGRRVSLAVKDGRIAALDADAARLQAPEREDLAGRLLLPGLVEGHIHLDKCFVGDAWKPHRPCSGPFDVRERVAFEKELLATAAPMERRAAALIALAVAQGTLTMRCHVDVDATVGLRHLETILAAREAWRDLVEIQIVAFPQSGILTCQGTAELLDAAVAAGADLVGGLDPASFDRDVERHLDVVFGIAERRGAGIDIHLHDPDRLGTFQLEQIAARTRALGLQGRVAVSHAYALGQVPLDVVRRTGEALAEAGVAIMTNAPGDSAFPPVLALREVGVTVFAGSDNIRDSWWPYGDADMLGRATMVGYRSGFYTDEELGVALDLATGAAAKALGLTDYGLRTGARADFIALPVGSVAEAVAAPPSHRRVYRGGRLVAEDGALSTPRPAAT